MILRRETLHRLSRRVAGVMLLLSAVFLPLAARSQDADDCSEADARVARQRSKAEGNAPEDQVGTEPADFVIEGICVDSAHAPLAGVRLRLFIATDRGTPADQIAESISDGKGRFRFTDLKPPDDRKEEGSFRMYAVVATHAGHASTIRQLFSPDARELEMVLSRPGTLSGVVTNEQGEPVSGAEVYFYGINGHAAPEALSTTTDADGFYELTGMAAFQSELIEVVDPLTRRLVKRPRSYTSFHVHHPDYGAQMAMTSAVPATVDIQLKTPAVVTGIVADAVIGDPAPGVRVCAQGTSRSEHRGWGETFTDVAGQYRMLLVPGTYNIWASMPGRTVVALDSYAAAAGENPPADLELIEGGFITGRVVDADGNPVGHAGRRKIRIGLHGPSRPRSGAAVESVVVSDDGTYCMRVPPGKNYPYIMTGGVRADRDPTNVRQSQPVIIQEGETETLDITVR